MLTKKQKDLLIFIHNRMKSGDVAPSFDEMREALHLKSKSGIHRLITGLVERGYLERLPHRARALEVKKLPDNYKDTNQASNILSDVTGKIEEFITQIPLCGKIAAGTPIEAIQHEQDLLNIPSSFVSAHDEHYALRVEGDSMINVGIHNDDIVVIRKADQARDGEIVVALVDQEEATLKRLRKDQGCIKLIPENDSYETQVYKPEQVQIQGVLASLYRTYH